MNQQEKGRLYLVPTPLGPEGDAALTQRSREIVGACTEFIVESLKMGRRHVKRMAPDLDLGTCVFHALNKHTPPEEYTYYLDAALAGKDICVLSDAGSPSIADPGAPIVQLAHRRGICVVPLPGPSSIMLALMASGLQGQSFTFRGYLSHHKSSLRRDLKTVEREARSGVTQIFMETPYRNTKMLQAILQTLSDDMQLCIACQLTLPDEWIHSRSIRQWKQVARPDLHKKPAIFLVGPEQ